jgi:hypothetical protein
LDVTLRPSTSTPTGTGLLSLSNLSAPGLPKQLETPSYYRINMRVNSYLAFYACAVNYEELLLFMHAFLNIQKWIKSSKITTTVKAEERQRPTKARTVKDERTKKMKVIVPKNYAKLPYDIARIGEREERKPFISSWSNSA